MGVAQIGPMKLYLETSDGDSALAVQRSLFILLTSIADIPGVTSHTACLMLAMLSLP